MTRAKKVILALICAAALCCAAIGGVLLARQPAYAAAGDVTALEIVIPEDTRFYVFEDLADVKEKITVNAEIEGGSSRDLDASEYVLSVQDRGDMTENNGQTFGDAAAGRYTLIVEPAEGVQASEEVRGTKEIEVRIDEVIGIDAEYNEPVGQTVYPHTQYNELQNYITVSLVYASGRRLSTGDYVLSGDMIAPAQIEGPENTYDVELTVTYNGDSFAGEEENRECIVTITGVTSVAPARINLNGNRPTSRSGEAFEAVQGELTFTVGYIDFASNSAVHWNAENFDWHYTRYTDGAYEVVTDESKTAFDWGTSNGGSERIVFTYTEGGTTIPGENSTGSIIEIGGIKYYYVDVQLLKEPYPELDIVTEYGAYSYGSTVDGLPYKYDEDGTGQEQIVSLGQQTTIPFNHEIVSITSVLWKDSQGNEHIITDTAVVLQGGVQTGKLSLTEVGTYTITLTLVNDMYYWNSLGENGENFITYTVVIEQAELVGTEFSFAGSWTYGEEANLPTDIKLVSRVDEDTTVSFAPPEGATINVTFTGTTNGGAQQTYSYSYRWGEQPSPGTNVPSLAGSYTVYVEVTGMANYADVTLANSGTNEEFQEESFTIARQGVAAPELTQERYTYTGDTITPQYSPTTSERWTASGDTSATAVKEGGYTIKFALTDDDNYCWGADGSDDTADKTLTWYIDQAENTITSVNAPGWTYGGAVRVPQITGSTFAENTHGLGDWSAATITYQYNGQRFDVPADTLGWNAGEYNYTITYKGNANIKDATYKGTFTVAKGQAEIAGTPTIEGWTYGGTANKPSGITGVTVSGTSLSPMPGSYAYYGTTNGSVSYGSSTAPLKDVPTEAGTYYVVYVVEETDDTDDYAGCTSDPAEFTIERAAISPAVTINGQGSDAGWVYDGEKKAAVVTGNLGNGTVTYTYGGRNHTTYSGTTQPTDAGEYTVKATVAQTDNYSAGEATLDFTISQKGVLVEFASDTEYTYTGAAVDVVLTVDGIRVDLAENEYFTVVSGCQGTDAGSYTATIAWKGNYKEINAADDFATAQRSKEVGTWTIDPFAVSLPDELAKTSVYSYNGQFVGTQQTWKWDNYNGFGTALRSGTPFSVTVSASGSGIAEGSYGSQANGQESGYLFATEAGVYTFTLELTSTKNFVWVSGGTDAKELTWTIGKAEVSVDVGEQQLEYDGNKKAPANIVDLNAGDTSVPSAYQNLYTIAGYAVGTTSAAVGTTAPNNYGTYYVAIDLKDGDNFVWKQAEQSQDVVSGDRLFIWYQITGTTYEITIGTISGWTYGTGTPSVPTLSGDTEILQDVIENYGSAITYTYQRQGEGGQWTTVYEVSYDVGDASYLLSVVPAEVAGTAGTYRLIVNVSAPSSNNYAEIVDEYSNTFTVSPYTLTEGDITWSGKSFTYKGSAYTYGTSADNDVYARHNTYSYVNGSYVPSSADAFFSLTLTSGGDAFTDAGRYTFMASTESGNYALSKDLAAKKYTIAQAELTIKAVDVPDVVYGTDAEEVKAKFTVTYDGLVEADRNGSDGNYTPKDGVLSGTLDYDCSYTAASEVDTYDITPRGVSAKNYKITFEKATLTVKAAGLQGVKIDNLTGENALTYQGAAYDIETVTGATATAVNPAQNVVTWYFSESEIASQPTNETQGIITSLTNVKREADHSVGTYTIYYYVSAPNHAAQTGSVQITIDPAALTLTAKDASVVYGEDFTADTSINSYTVQIDGSAEDTLLGSDTKESVFGSFVPSYQAYVAEGDTYNAGDGVTESGYIAFDCSTPQLDNYTVTQQSGSFTVSPRAITVEIGDLQQTYGDSATAFVYSVTLTSAGATGNAIFSQDSEAGVFTLAVYQVGAEGGAGSSFVPDNKTDVGVYYIVGTAENDNYAVTFSGSLSYNAGANNAGKYEIVARVLGNLDWTDPKSLVYDGKQKAFTATGRYGEGENAEEVSFTITYQRQTGEGAYGEETSDAPVNVGSYRVIARSNDPNFTQGLESTRTFAITPYTVTIDWNEEITLVYNGEEQSGKVSATYQTVAGDAIALAVTPDAEMKDAAKYTLTASFAEDDNALGNYALPGVVTQKYTISPRPIVVTIEDQTVEYGEVLFADIADTLSVKSVDWDTTSKLPNDDKGGIVDGAKPYVLALANNAVVNTDGYLDVEEGGYGIFGEDSEPEGLNNYKVEFVGENSQATNAVYTVSPRNVTISFGKESYTATYGTDEISEIKKNIQYTHDGETAQVFIGDDSLESVVGSGVSILSRGKEGTEVNEKESYSEIAPAGSIWELYLRVGNTEESTLTKVNYTFTFTDTAELTVGQRAITVAIGDIPGEGEELLYGTDAVADAYAKRYDYVSVTPSTGVGGSALVNGDTKESVFSLTVYGTGGAVVPDDTTPAGTYYIAGAPLGGNYAITFTGSATYDEAPAGTFIITVNGDAQSGISVFMDGEKQAVFTYDGKEHYLLLTGEGDGTYGRLGDLAMADGLNLRAAVNNVAWDVAENNPFLWQFSFTDSTTTGADGMPQFDDQIVSIKDVTTENDGVYTVYYIVYLPENLNYAAATGSFTVKVEQATNEWTTDEYGHKGWAYNEQTSDASETNPLFDGLEAGSQFTAPQAVFGTAYNQEDGTVSGVTFTYYRDDTYAESARIADPATFFNYNTPAGTYYVKVEVAGTDNYTGLTGYYELDVARHILSVRWSPENLTVDDGLTGTSVIGYNERFMEYVAADLTVTASGTDFTAQKPANTGRYGATFIIKDELLANYEWASADGNDAANCTIYFTVSEAENVVTVTITTDVGGTEGWTYGDSVTFAAYQLGSAGQSGTIVVTATSMQNVSYAYARDVAGVTDGSDSRLVYNISALPTDAGTYWVRAYVTGDIDEGYGNKAGYAKFTVAKYQVAVPTGGALLGDDDGVYNGSVHTWLPTLGGFTWDNNYGMAVLTLVNGEQVILRVSGNRAIDAGLHTAAISPVNSDNYVWEGGSADEQKLEWSIEKQTLKRPFIGENGKYSLTTTYSPSTTMKELIGFKAEVMGFAGAAYGSSYYYADRTSYLQAGNAGNYWISISLKYPNNYKWATDDGYSGDNAEAYTRLTWTITKAVFSTEDFAFTNETFTYNGLLQHPAIANLPDGLLPVQTDGTYYTVTAEEGIEAGVDAGTHTVSVTLYLTGTYAQNYTLQAGEDISQITISQEYTIGKAVISDVTWTVQKHYTYTGRDQFEVVKAYYGLGGSIHELQVAVQEFKNYREGGYTFTVEGFQSNDANAKNYTLSGTFSETFYIDKLPVYIVVGEASGSHIYDGQRPQLTAYGFRKVAVYGMDGDDLRDKFIEKYDQADWEANMRFALLDADGNAPSAWNVGTYIVTVTGAEDLQNYDVTRIQTGSLEIVPKEIAIDSISSPGATYGDETFASAEVTGVSGLVAGDTLADVSFLYTYTGTADDGAYTANGILSNEMHAGSYTVTVSLAAGGNYVLAGSASARYEVSPLLVDPALVEIDDLPYTGQAQTLTKEDTRFTGTGSAYDLFDYSIVAESGTETGGYRVTLIIGNVNYLWQSGAAGYGNMTTDRTWRIVEAQSEDISVSLPQVGVTDWGKTAASVTAGGSVAAIGGTEISVNITYLFEVKDESGNWVGFTGSVWNAGEYRVRAEAASDNFPAAYSDYYEFTVQPGVYDVSALAFADMTFTYDGQAHNLVLTVNGSAVAGGSIGGGALGATGTVSYTLGKAEADAGTYTMTAVLTAGANYTFRGGETAYELTGTLVIKPYAVTIRWAEDDFTYDKQDHSGDVRAYFIGAGNSHIDLDLALEGAAEMIDAGEYTFTVAGASDQSGAAVDLANYVLAGGGDVAGAQKEYTVRKFAATVNWGQTSFTYNGEDQIASVQPNFIGVGGEEIALSVKPQALQDFGSYTFEVVIGEELKNYELSNMAAQIFIAKLPVTVTADDISAALGAAEQALTYTLAPSEAAAVFAADEAAGRVEVSLSRVPGTAAGAYDIYISVTGEGAENYALTLVGGTYTIRERAIELSIELPADLVYSGAPKAAVLTAKEAGGGEVAVPAGITLWYEGKDNAGNAYASAQAPVNAGSYTVGVRVDTQDYDVSNPGISVQMTIARADASIDVSDVQTQYTYTGELQRVDSGAVLSHGESSLVYSNNTFTTVAEGDGKTVSVDAAMSCNYKAAHAEVTITVAKAAISPAVSINGWTYGQSANGYTVTGNPGGGAIEAVYGGTTNAGAAYSGGQAPTEAGSYTLTVTVAETENYLGGSASTSFTVARAALHVSVSIESWAFGESPNGYTVSPASMRDTITSVRYAGEGYSDSQPPTQVGSYTLTVTFARTANYQGGSASDSFSITQGTLAPDSVRLTIEGWTYGEAPNSPVLTGAPAGAEVSYRYSGTANDGTAWNSDTAPSKAGSYKVTAHISAEGYASFEAEASFTVARRLVSAPTLGDTGGRTASSVYDGEEVRIAVTGYDGALMDFTAKEGTQLVMEGQQLLLAADAEGTYVLQVSLKDIYNYGWADLAEGEQIAGDIALTWEVTLAMHSLLWLIVLLLILLLILIVLLIVFAKKDHDARARIAAAQQGAESEADGAADERRNYALAPAGLLFAVPVWQISLIAALAVAAAVLLVADVVLLVLWRKDAAKACRAEEAVQEAAAAAQEENMQAENAQEAGGDENSASAE